MLKNELTALRARMNPHFIFNSLNSVQRYILNNDATASQRFLSKFAKLIRYVVDHSNFNLISLSEEMKALELYLQLEAERLQNSFEYIFEVDDNIDSDDVMIPSMLIQPYIENAIWHGIADKKEGLLKIKIMAENEILHCVIEDNGIGRAEAARRKTGSGLHKSVAMNVTSERLDIINNMRKQKVNMKITDLYNSDGTAAGTRVEIFIPLS